MTINRMFRGKTIEGERNKWVYGYLMYDDDENIAIIGNSELTDDEWNGTEINIVDSKTVTEYIGIDDKNGVPIFNGDIVNVYPFSFGFCGEVDQYADYPAWCLVAHRLPGGKSDELIPGEAYDFTDFALDLAEITVIGNIFDDEGSFDDGEENDDGEPV